MTSYDDGRSVSEQLSGTTVDTVKLTQGWNKILITNLGSLDMFVRFDAVNPTATGADGDYIIPAKASRSFGPAGIMAGGPPVPGSTTTPFHEIRLVSDSGNNTYTVEGYCD